MKCIGCNGNCEQGRKPCDCNQEFCADPTVGDIVVGFLILLYIIGLLMEMCSA